MQVVKKSSTSGLATLKQIKGWRCENMKSIILDEMEIETSFPAGYLLGSDKESERKTKFWNTLTACESEWEETEFEWTKGCSRNTLTCYYFNV